MQGLGFNETKKEYTPQDMRFTQKGDTLYAILFQRPADGKVLIKSLAGWQKGIKNVQVLGYGDSPYTCDGNGLSLSLPESTNPIPVVRITLQPFKKDF